MISRRKLLSAASRFGPAAAAGFVLPAGMWRWPLFEATPEAAFLQVEELIRNAPKARYWVSTATQGVDCLKCHNPAEDLSNRLHHARDKGPVVRCLLCAQSCIIPAGERGKCRARINVKGELYSLVYGRPITTQLDPIEKKPFYHFLPGSGAFSLATSGCPLRCKFCQNWEISQARPEEYPPSTSKPADIVDAAVARSAPVIAFTYNEPTVFLEYLVDIAKIARKQKRRSVMISCGYMNPEPLAEMCQVLDAIKIDLKGYDPSFYRNVCGAELSPVLRSIRQISRSGIHLEIVNLVVPTLNDSDKMLHGLVNWVMGELGPDVPVHFTAFHPDYQLLNLPPTPVQTLERARDLALSKGIHYPFVGNVPDHPGNHTYCPGCRKIVIRRSGFFVLEINLKDGHCKYCGKAIAGIWA
jgi:pyruvate formate lyase activating enzyme